MAPATLSRLRSAANLGERSLLGHLQRELSVCESVLDLGCGRSSVLEALPRLPRSVGVDAFPAAIQDSRSRGAHDDYIQADVTALELAPGSFDAVLMMDLIEHLDHATGEALIERMVHVAARRMLIFTPNGFVDQHEYDDNPLQVHRSGWTVEDFRRRGFQVVGIKGWRPLRGPESTPRRPVPLTRALSSLSQPFIERRPRHAYSLLAIARYDV